MAIRNANLAGTDWTSGDICKAGDLNDTFDAAVELIQESPCFWLNSELYTVYDDFESYTVGAFTSNTSIAVTDGGVGSIEIVSSTTAGGTGKELVFTAGNTTADVYHYMETVALPADRHAWFRLYGKITTEVTSGSNESSSLTLGIGTETPVSVYGFVSGDDDSPSMYGSVFRVAKGSDVYDVYYAGRKVFSDVTQADAQLKLVIKAGGTNSTPQHKHIVAIDDIRNSKKDV